MLQPSSCTNLAGGLFAGISQQLRVELPSQPAEATAPQPPDTASAAQNSAPGHTDTTPNPEAALPLESTSSQTPPSTLQPIRSVFIFTDGRPTVGPTATADIIKSMKNMLSEPPAMISNDGVTEDEDAVQDTVAGADSAAHPPPNVQVHTFGFGSDSDPNMLTAIAECGSGSYYFINTPDDIPAAFADALGGILSVAAQNVIVRIVPVNGARVTSVRSGFTTTPDGNGGYVLRLPDMYAEEVKDLVISVAMPSMHGEDVPEDVEFTAARVTIEFMDTVRARPTVLSGEMRIRRSAEAEAEREVPAGANIHVRAQMTRLNAMDSMLQAMSLADRGGYTEARTVLRGIEEDLQSLAVSEASDEAPSDDVAAAAAMVAQLRLDVSNMARGYASQHAYQSGGRAYSSMMSKSHATQRSTHISSMPLAGPSPPPLAASRLGVAPGIRGPVPQFPTAAPNIWSAPADGLPSPPTPLSPSAARPRSASGVDPGTPTKKSRVKMFLNQVQHSFQRSSRDGEDVAALPGEHTAGPSLRPGAVGVQGPVLPTPGNALATIISTSSSGPPPGFALPGSQTPAPLAGAGSVSALAEGAPTAGAPPASTPDDSALGSVAPDTRPPQDRSVSIYANRRQAKLAQASRAD